MEAVEDGGGAVRTAWQQQQCDNSSLPVRSGTRYSCTASAATTNNIPSIPPPPPLKPIFQPLAQDGWFHV